LAITTLIYCRYKRNLEEVLANALFAGQLPHRPIDLRFDRKIDVSSGVNLVFDILILSILVVYIFTEAIVAMDFL
jgi:hypothetical protein